MKEDKKMNRWKKPHREDRDKKKTRERRTQL
jgi:hypothetical protein